MGWFKRIKEGITTSTNEKKETPEGLWYNCPKCKTIITDQGAQTTIICVCKLQLSSPNSCQRIFQDFI